MADLTKTKVIDIQTGKSEKNVKNLTKTFTPLKQQIRDLRNQLAQLEEGTDEYNRVAKKLADTNQRNIEISEAMKYSNKDIGQTLSNLTNVATGAVASINAISASMQLLGIDADEGGEALKNIQLTMAVIQGMASLDTAIKSLQGLRTAFFNVKDSAEETAKELKTAQSGFETINVTKKAFGASTDNATTSELNEASALSENTAEMAKNNEEAQKYTELQKENTEATLNSAEAINLESKAHNGNTTALDQEIAKLRLIVDEQNKMGTNRAVGSAFEFLDKVINNLTNEIDICNEQIKKATKEGDASLLSSVTKFKKSTEKALATYRNLKTNIENGTTDISEAVAIAVSSFENNFEDAMTNSEINVSELIDKYKELIPLMSDEQFALNAEYLEKIEKEYRSHKDTLTDQADALRDGIDELKEYRKQVKENQGELSKLEKEQINQLGFFKKFGVQMKAHITSTKLGAKAWTLFGKAGSLAWKTIKAAFIATGIGLLISLATDGIMFLIDKVKELGAVSKEQREITELEASASKSYQEQTTKLQILTGVVNDSTKSYEERNSALKEIKKEVPEYHAQLTKEGKLINNNTEAITEYCDALLEKARYEAYEKKYIELLQEEIDKKNAIIEYDEAGFWFRMFHNPTARQREYNDVLREEEMIMKRINSLDFSKVFKEEQKGSGSSVTVALKSYVDYLKEIKTLLQNIWGTYFDELDLETTFNRYDPTKAFRSAINRILKTGSDVSGMFTDWFKDALNKGIENINPNDLNLNQIFKVDSVNDIDNQIWQLTQEFDQLSERYKNQKNLTAKQSKQWEKEKKEYNERVDKLKAQQKAISDITKGTENYLKSQDDIKKKYKELDDSRAKYNAQLAIEAKYRKQLADIDKYMDAEADKNIATAKMEINAMNQLQDADQKRLDFLKSKKDLTKAENDEIITLEQNLFNRQKQIAEQLTQIESNEYTKRTNRMQKYYKEIDQSVNNWINNRSNTSTAHGWGTQDYNVQIDTLLAQWQAVNEKIATLNQQADMDEGERLQRMLELQQQQADLEVQIEQEKVNRKININQTYYNALSNITSGISSILQNEMSNYDENSQQYKDLAVANAWIDTLSGSLSAFMSGFQSGLPWPSNVALATVLGGLSFTAGVQQIEAIKNGSTTNALTSSASSVGSSTYDTTSYQTQSELFGKITDTKVWVSEHDITSTQNRVSVRENNATF